LRNKAGSDKILEISGSCNEYTMKYIGRHASGGMLVQPMLAGAYNFLTHPFNTMICLKEV
jgi:hypothetical protein